MTTDLKNEASALISMLFMYQFRKTDTDTHLITL